MIATGVFGPGQPDGTGVLFITGDGSRITAAQGRVGQIPGWSALSAAQTRRLVLQAGSIWKRIVTDPLTGRAIEASAGTYRVPAAMADQPRSPAPRPPQPQDRRLLGQ